MTHDFDALLDRFESHRFTLTEYGITTPNIADMCIAELAQINSMIFCVRLAKAVCGEPTRNRMAAIEDEFPDVSPDNWLEFWTTIYKAMTQQLIKEISE
jgi:hypothetical protein